MLTAVCFQGKNCKTVTPFFQVSTSPSGSDFFCFHLKKEKLPRVCMFLTQSLDPAESCLTIQDTSSFLGKPIPRWLSCSPYHKASQSSQARPLPRVSDSRHRVKSQGQVGLNLIWKVLVLCALAAQSPAGWFHGGLESSSTPFQ